MQNYSQALDLDMLNRRYWYRRMQQCKAEFKARPPQPINPSLSSPSFSSKLQTPSSKDWDDAKGPNRPFSKPIGAKAVIPPMVEQPPQVDPLIQSDPHDKGDGITREGIKERPILAASKSSRPIKYSGVQIR